MSVLLRGSVTESKGMTGQWALPPQGSRSLKEQGQALGDWSHLQRTIRRTFSESDSTSVLRRRARQVRTLRWRYALFAGVVAALLPGCGGSQSGLAAQSGALPNALRPASHRVRNASGSYGDLVYVTTSRAIVMLSYPQWKIVGTISGGFANSEICADPRDGNVFVTELGQIVEYAHGGTKPIATLDAPSPYQLLGGCAVDPTTGNLAVASYDPVEVLIYAGAQGSATVHADKKLTTFDYPAYDNAGNLYVTAATKTGAFRIAELKARHTRFEPITLNEDVRGGKIQWDGTYLTFQNWLGQHRGRVLYQVQVNGHTGTVVNEAQLLKAGGDPNFWLQNGSVIGLYGGIKSHNDRAVAAWPYPSGGKPSAPFFGIARGAKNNVIDFTVSVEPSP
jgi:hypothetical protein